MLKDIGCGLVSEKDISKRLFIAGWVQTVRDHGNLVFVDIEDITGEIQVVFSSENEHFETVKKLKEGDVVRIYGEVLKRPQGTENPKISTGSIEIKAETIDMLNQTKTLPFTLEEEPDEAIRLKYRYIDLRRPKMRKNILFRHLLTRVVREKLWEEGFIEIETPFLTKSTPEGARDFLVPSRFYPGKFYALPQSPQLFKQVLQVAGFEKYFQIVRCFRDEDLRADRQPEFTQIDIEMSFVDENDIIALVERLLKTVLKKTVGYDVDIPFRRMTYSEAIEKYGSDKPDIRLKFNLEDVSDIFAETSLSFIRKELEKKDGAVKGFGVPVEITKQKFSKLEQISKSYGGGGILWFVAKDGKITSSVIQKYLTEEEKKKLYERFHLVNGTIILIAGNRERISEILWRISLNVAKEYSLLEGDFKFVWIVDFPLFSWSEEEKRFVSVHHPFTSPNLKDLEFLYLENGENIQNVRARAYDIVLNGQEIGGGSIRIHRSDIQERIFNILKISEKEAQDRFGFLLEALSYGAPPHGGIALGLDRIVSILLGEESIREVIPFPKTQSATCLLTDAPSPVFPSQLNELKLKIVE